MLQLLHTLPSSLPVNLAANDPIPAITQTTRFRVVCVSRDPLLGETRCALLQRRYDAVSVGSVGEFAAIMAASLFDLIVLCHTLFPDEFQHCLQLAKHGSPDLKVLSVSSHVEEPRPGIDGMVLGLSGPLALLRAVDQVLPSATPGTRATQACITGTSYRKVCA